MEQCLGDLNMKICVIYLDDLIIFSRTLEEHLDRLDKVLTRLRGCNLKLSPKKCKFLQTKVKYVGHIVLENGVEADPEMLKNFRICQHHKMQKRSDSSHRLQATTGVL